MKVMLKNKVWDQEAVQTMLRENDLAVGRALMVVYNNQTIDEKDAMITRHTNGKGFTGHDAAWLTDVALKWKRWGRWASPRQCAAVRKSMLKYHRQILQSILDNNADAVLITRGMKLPEPAQQPVEPAGAWSCA